MPGNEGRRDRVLVIDDEVIFATSLRRALSREYAVTIATDGHAALALIEAGEPFDAILCDLMMPGLTGMSLHAALSLRQPQLADRMIFLTGGAFTPESQAFLDSVPDRWFEKPCELEELRARLRHLIG